jgi:hypothetical protein
MDGVQDLRVANCADPPVGIWEFMSLCVAIEDSRLVFSWMHEGSDLRSTREALQATW